MRPSTLENSDQIFDKIKVEEKENEAAAYVQFWIEELMI